MESFKFRDGIKTDINFIYKTWLDSYRYDSDLGKQCRNSIFFPQYQLIIDSILYNDAKVLVCCKPDEEDIIFGYIIYEPDILHYIFVKQAFQNLGIGMQLYRKAQSPKIYTHKTNNFLNFSNRNEMIYNPFLLFKGVK
jgi:hypothetical protein